MTHSATYSPDDNKLRLYPDSRLDAGDYALVKAAGFRWAPKQELFFATWNPGAEDILIEWCSEIEDDDKSLTDRAEERSERFENYSANRAKDADGARAAVSAIADNIPLGQPILIGHHSEKHARRDAAKIENGMRKAVKMWEQSQYWQYRAAGAIRNAKYKERPDVRARRIKTIEADKRKQERTKNQAEKFLKAWSSVKPLPMQTALSIANYDHISHCFTLAEYPRELPASQYEGSMGFWSALTDGVITADQAAELAIPAHTRMIEWSERWIAHYEHRLEYESAMLGESGGTVADKTGPEKGGACRCWASPAGGWSYIQKINKISVTVLDNWGNGGRNFTRNIPFDKLKAIMTAAEVQAARDAGNLIEADKGGGAGPIGFFLRGGTERPDDAPAAADPEPKQEKTASADFEALKDQLKAGVKVVSAPQLFPTPPELAARMVDLARPEIGARVLEPSAGTGNLLRALPGVMPFPGQKQTACEVVAVEINGSLTEALESSGLAQRVICTDFLTCTVEGEPSSLGKFDCIIMNPPFKNGDDIKHIQHARKFLKPGGRLVALCANGPRQREALQDEAEHWEDLPAGSFAAEGTGVNVAMLLITEPEEVAEPEPVEAPAQIKNRIELQREQGRTLRKPITSAPRGFQTRLFA